MATDVTTEPDVQRPTTDMEREWDVLVQRHGDDPKFWEMVERDVSVNKR